MSKACPRITRLVWNIVDPPWSFYSISYDLDNYAEHVVYIPERLIAEELKTMTFEEILANKLRATIDCIPEHIDRIDEEMKNATKRSAKQATRVRKKS